MDDISKKREEVLSAYRSVRDKKVPPAWDRRVKQMSDQQIVAVWFRMKAEGKI